MLREARVQTRKFLERARRSGKRSTIWRAARSVLRTQQFTLDFDRALRTLEQPVEFFEGEHWAETDGETISLSCTKPFTAKSVKLTLLHEVMHYLVLRGGRHEVSEPAEHRIMEMVDPKLV